MATHQFSVHVPNPTDKAASVILSLRPAKMATVKSLRLATHESPLKVTNAFLATEPCSERGKPELKVKLKPHSSMNVYVVIQTAGTAKPGSVFYDLIDQRGTKQVGGVLLICQEPSIPEAAGQLINTRNPCPIKLQSPIYFINAGDDPTKPLPLNKITLNADVQIVAPVINPTSKPVKEVMAYLEHLGISGVEFEPGSWNIGTMQPKDVFYATWTVKITTHSALLQASIVVTSQQKDPVRLNSTIAFGGKRNG